MQIEFRVPLTPPSINHLWKSSGKHRFKGPEAKVFISAVSAMAPKEWTGHWDAKQSYQVEMIFGIHAKRFKRCDCDNLVKVSFDALQECGIIRNDSDISWFSAGKVEVPTLRDEFTKYLVRTV